MGLPVITPRQPKTKSSNDQALNDILPVIQPKQPIPTKAKNNNKTNHNTSTSKNYSSQLTDAEWEEIKDILRPGFPSFNNLFHHSNSSLSNNITSKNSNSTLPYSPQPHQSLKVLAVCLSVLLFSLFALCCRFYWESRSRRKGYSAAPSNPPEDPKYDNDDDDVIAEVVNRREQTPVNNAGSNKSQTPSQKSLYYPAPNKSTPQQSSNNDFSTKKSTRASKGKIIFKDPPSDIPQKKQNDGVRFASDSALLVSSNQSHTSPPSVFSDDVAARQSTSSPAIISTSSQEASTTCPLNDAKPLKLIPVESLVIPRTFNDALIKAFPDMANSSKMDVDTVLNLSHLEKSQSRPNLVLQPIPANSKMNISAEPDFPSDEKVFEAFGRRPQPLLLPFQREDLNSEEKEEERLKFLRACWKTEMRRRRSLCSISNNEDLVDPKLYNAIVHSAGSHYSARKVKSLPTMTFTAFTKLVEPHPTTKYSTDALGESPMWSPPSYFPPPPSSPPPLPSRPEETTGSSRSRSSSVSSNFQDDWQNLRKSAPVFTTKAFSVQQEANIHPSVTSIWSTVASENAIEHFSLSEDDDDDVSVLKVKAGVEAIKMVQESEKQEEKREIDTLTTLSLTASPPDDDDDPGDKVCDTNISRKKSLSCVDFILESVKSTTANNITPTHLRHNVDHASKESITLESDRLPSELFAVYRSSTAKSSTTSVDSLLGEGYSISKLFDKSPSSFWDRINTRVDYQMGGGGSGMVSRRAVNAGAIIAGTTNQMHSSHNKIGANDLLNTKKK